MVLLVACANVANLLLARGTGRLARVRLARRDWRRSQAAWCARCSPRARRSASLGAAGGLLLAFWATRALTTLAATGIPRADQIGLNGAVLGFAVVAALSTSVVFGLLPALHLSKQDLNDALKEGGRSQGAAIGRGARELLIVAEVAMSIVLLVGAGLLIRSLWQLQQVNPGFCAEQGAGDGSVAADRALRRRRADAVLSAARGAHRRKAGRRRGRRDQHPAAEHQLRQPRHAGRRSSEAGRAGLRSAGAIGHAGLLRGDGHPDARRPQLRCARRRQRSARGDRQRVDGAKVLAGRDRTSIGKRITFNSGIPARAAAGRRRPRLARRDWRGRQRQASRPR